MMRMTDHMTHPYQSLSAAPAPGSPLAAAVEQARERAIRLLSDGYAYDVLTEAEFEWRLGQLSGANSPTEVEALVADLAPVNRMAAVGATAMVLPAPPDERLVGFMSDSRRDGRWSAPHRLKVVAVMSHMRIDLRYAVIPAGCTIEVRAFMANVAFTAPPGMVVGFDVTPVMSSTRNDASAMHATGDWRPHVQVRGSAIMSEVRVRVREPGR